MLDWAAQEVKATDLLDSHAAGAYAGYDRSATLESVWLAFHQTEFESVLFRCP